MKKDPIVKLIRRAEFVWNQAKKPVLQMKLSGNFALLPSQSSTEDGAPKALLKADLSLTLVYLLLGLLALKTVFRIISAIFRW